MSSRSTQFPLYALAIGFLATGIAGCHGNNQNSTNQGQTQNPVATQAADESQDPAEQANLAPAVSTTSENSQQQAAPPPPSDNQNYDNDNQNYDNNNQNYDNYGYNAPESYEPATYAPDPPPPLPDYDQPEAPGPDYIWTPGYWNYANNGYNNAGYYWVPGAWVLAPYTGALWTPGYWGYYNHRYAWHRGYWGPHIGFYGGVNYGYGYTGVGYVGGYWDNDRFRYNTAVTRVNPSIIHDTYSHRVRVVTNPHISYNGPHGISARPLTAERVALREPHVAPLAVQTSHKEQASRDRSLWVSQNHGHPRTVVVAKPLNEGRRAPAPMPANVRDQIQHEHAIQHERAGNPPAARTTTPAPHPENRPGQPARPQTQNQFHNQARPATGNPAARTETRPAPRNESRPMGHPATRNEAQPQTSHPATRNEAQPQTNHPVTRNEARPQTSHPVTRNEAHPQTNHPVTRNEAHPQTGHAATRNEAQPQANHPATRNETQPQANHAATRPESHTQAHPQTRSTARPSAAHPAQSHSTTRPETRHNTNAHTTNQKKHEQPKRDENNPQL